MLAPLALLLVQDHESAPRAEFDLRIPLEVSAEDAILDGHGPSKRVAYVAPFAGTLHVWTSAPRELDLFVRVEEASGALLYQDDDSGGGNAPYVTLAVEPGRALTIHAALAKGSGSGAFELSAIAAPETPATGDATARAQAAISEIRALRQAQDVDAARALVGRALDELLAAPGARESDRVARSVVELESEADALELPQVTLRAWRHLCAHRARTLPPDHAELQQARGNLARNLSILGEAAGARTIYLEMLDVSARTLPDDDLFVQKVRHALASALKKLGDYAGARALEEQVLAVRSRALPAEHAEVLAVRQTLADTLRALGDPVGARALQEEILEIRSRTLPEEHALVQTAREHLAVTLGELGDRAGARVLLERVLEVLSQSLPDDHPRLQQVRASLAITLRELGDLDSARALEEKVLEVRSKTLPDDHIQLQRARGNLANTLRALNDRAGARDLQAKVLDVFSRTLPEDHPDLQRARANLAVTLRELGDLDGVSALEEKVFEVRSRTHADDHLDLQRARMNLARTTAALAAIDLARGAPDQALRRRERFGELALAFARSLQRTSAHAVADGSSREVEERITSRADFLDSALSFATGLGVFEEDPRWQEAAFLASESMRGAALSWAAVEKRSRSDPELDDLRLRARDATEELARATRAGADAQALSRARSALESAQRELILRAREIGDAQSPIASELAALSERLASNEAFVAYRGYDLRAVETADPPREHSTPSLCAFVFRRSAEAGGWTLRRVELGPIAPIEAAVNEWRRALGTAAGRGLAVAPSAPSDTDAAGRTLRRLVLDPLREHFAGVDRTLVAVDDVLHAVALDALPADDSSSALLGDRMQLDHCSSLFERSIDAPRAPASSVLVALGGADFGGATATASGLASVAVLRGSAWEQGFTALPGTLEEARALERQFTAEFRDRGECILLAQADASRARLFALAPKARFLHLATHGWFAPESVKSADDRISIDPASGLVAKSSGEESVERLSPMLLCGLALSGANASNAAGVGGGLVTAEELATLDLSQCELAVLSACDTNVGIQRAGQGVASLQRALHMAGARSVITSLWKVPDEATKELMVDFYRRLWVGNEPKWKALWEAKKKLRDAKDERGKPIYSTRDWAAWVLSGAPD